MSRQLYTQGMSPRSTTQEKLFYLTLFVRACARAVCVAAAKFHYVLLALFALYSSRPLQRGPWHFVKLSFITKHLYVQFCSDTCARSAASVSPLSTMNDENSGSKHFGIQADILKKPLNLSLLIRG
jgi:hypothetical protein